MTDDKDVSYGDDAADEANCYTNRQKQCCQRFITGVAVLSFIIGLVLAIYGYLSIGGLSATPEIGEYTTEFTVEANAFVAYMCIAGGILAIVIGILGCLTAYCMNPLVTCPFGLVAFLVAILAFIVAGAVFASDTTAQLYQDVCETPLPVYSFGNSEQATGTTYMRNQYGSLVDDVMCADSQGCLCDNSAFQLSGIQDLTSEQLHEYGQVGREVADYTGGEPWILLSTDESGLSVYQECYDQQISPAAVQVDDDNSQWDEFVTNGGYEYMAQLEQDYECASICYKPLFYLTKDISEAPVGQECVTAFIDYYAGSLGVGIVAIVTGLILLSACIGSVPLCGGFASGAMGGG